MRCCVVGCGAAGIIAAKHLKQEGIDFDVYEMTDDIGGTWIYTEKETDSFGNTVHTAMYKSLRTNLPKDIMAFEGFQYDTDNSFLKSSDILNYFKKFVSNHKLMDHIKLGHIVKNITYQQDKWLVTVENLATHSEILISYNFIMVCNGHHFNPRYPNLNGRDAFEGLQMHSKNYRVPAIFKGKSVLVIGFGPSGQDITDDASKEAKQIFLSHHANNFNSDIFRSNVVSKPDVIRLNRDSVTFKDGTTESIDAVLYCTGYYYTFPFLDSTCGITVEDNYVRPLHRQVVNINKPSMAFIGLPFKAFIFPLLEVQVKAFVKVITGQATLPTKEVMINELQEFEKSKSLKSIAKRKYHQLENLRDYIRQLNEMGNLKDVPEVLYKIYDYNFKKRHDNLIKYRQYKYNVINDNEFTVHLVEK